MHHHICLNRKSKLLSMLGTPPTRALTGPQVAGYFGAQLQKAENDRERNRGIAAANAYVVSAGGVYGA